MRTKLKFGGQEREFLFSTWIARKLSDESPGQLLDAFNTKPLETWQDIAFETLKEGENTLAEGYGIREFLIDLDDATEDVQDHIREGVKRCMNIGGKQSLQDQFSSIYENMSEEDKAFVKEVVIGGPEKNGQGVKVKGQHPALVGTK